MSVPYLYLDRYTLPLLAHHVPLYIEETGLKIRYAQTVVGCGCGGQGKAVVRVGIEGPF